MTRTFAPTSPFYNTADAGSGGTSASAPIGSGGGDTGSGAGSGSGTAPAPIALSPDSMVIPPGASQPVKWGDYSKQYIHADQVKRDQAAYVKSFVENLGKVASQNRGRQSNQQPNTQARTQPVDMFADVRGLPLIDGQTLSQLGERIQREGIGPLYEWAQQVNKVLEAVNGRLQSTERAAGSLVENRSRGEFERKMSAAVDVTAKELFPGVNVAEHPVLNELAQDVFLSYDPNDPTLEKEFPSIFKSRIDGLLKLAAVVNQAKLKAAREQHRAFLRPGGNGQPSGQSAGQRLSHRDIARNIFAASSNT